MYIGGGSPTAFYHNKDGGIEVLAHKSSSSPSLWVGSLACGGSESNSNLNLSETLRRLANRELPGLPVQGYVSYLLSVEVDNAPSLHSKIHDQFEPKEGIQEQDILRSSHQLITIQRKMQVHGGGTRQYSTYNDSER